MGNLREIKFRVWDSISKAFHYWGNIQNNKFNDFDLEHYTLMQYTGLKDKNGIDIYEGDIVIGDNETYKWIVKWNNLGYYYLFSDTDGHNRKSPFHLNDMRTQEVIGNIYQNPELL